MKHVIFPRESAMGPKIHHRTYPQFTDQGHLHRTIGDDLEAQVEGPFGQATLQLQEQCSWCIFGAPRGSGCGRPHGTADLRGSRRGRRRWDRRLGRAPPPRQTDPCHASGKYTEQVAHDGAHRSRAPDGIDRSVEAGMHRPKPRSRSRSSDPTGGPAGSHTVGRNSRGLGARGRRRHGPRHPHHPVTVPPSPQSRPAESFP